MTGPDHTELIHRLLGPAEPEIGCDECLQRLDEYVDAERSGEEADRLVPGMRAHLAGCPACAEDHETLRAYSARPGR
jgi:anti-sigma factor RsiW